MRYGIFSDIHSNLEAFDEVIKAYKKESIDTYLCVGDAVGYGADPQDCIEKTKALVSITVAGNHDWAAVDLFSTEYFNPLAAEAILWTKKKLSNSGSSFLGSLKLVYENQDLTLVHGTLDNPHDFNYLEDDYAAGQSFECLKTNICFVGHSHVAGAFVLDKNGEISYSRSGSIRIVPDKKYIVNVGSIGQPRDGNPKAAYCIYDTARAEVTIKRIDYDIDTARNKIIKAGLPKFLGDRLLTGT